MQVGGAGPGTRAGTRLHVAGLERAAALPADAVLVDLAAAAAVDGHDGRPIGVGMAGAPLHEGEDHRPEIDALLGEPVLVARRPLLVEPAFEDALVDEQL